MLQKTINNEELKLSFHNNLPSISRTKQQRLSEGKPTSLPPSLITKKTSPIMELSTINQSFKNYVANEKALKMFLICVFAVRQEALIKKVVPALAGFI